MSRIKGLAIIIIGCVIGIHPGFSQDTGTYDKEISKLAAKIRQYPGRTKNLVKLKEIYYEALAIDQAKISSLLQTGQPDIWYKIYKAYAKIDSRQKIIKGLPERARQQLSIEFVDYQTNIAEARYKAIAYFYAHGEKLLQSDKQEDAKLAYLDFLHVADLNPSYKELDKEIRRSILKAATHVEFEMHNRTRKVVSSAMIGQLSSIIWEFKKVKYGQQKPEREDLSFTFILRVILDEIEISPDQVKQLQYQEERDVFRDDQVIDTLKCLVEETRQLKKAQITGSLEYVDKQTGQVVNRVPIRVETIFANAYASLQGDVNAAGDETRELLQSKRAPYPSNEQMILDATEEFSKKAKEVILSE